MKSAWRRHLLGLAGLEQGESHDGAIVLPGSCTQGSRGGGAALIDEVS